MISCKGKLPEEIQVEPICMPRRGPLVPVETCALRLCQLGCETGMYFARVCAGKLWQCLELHYAHTVKFHSTETSINTAGNASRQLAIILLDISQFAE